MRTPIQAAALVLMASTTQAQVFTQTGPQTVTIRAEGVPIASLISEIARVHPLDRVTFEGGVEQRPVSIVLEDVPPSIALAAVLQASGLDFAIAGRRIIVGQWTGPDRAPANANRVTLETLRETQQQASAAAARAEASTAQQAASDAAGDESAILPTAPVAFTASGENITYADSTFVPYKMRPEVRALRTATDVAKIP